MTQEAVSKSIFFHSMPGEELYLFLALELSLQVHSIQIK